MDNLELAPPWKAGKSLKRLAQVGVALTTEKDVDRLMNTIVESAMALANADGGTLYILDKKENTLHFKVMQNKSLGIHISGNIEHSAEIPLPVPLYIDGAPNHSNVSSHVALTGNIISIPDVYEAKEFNFQGTKKYDEVSGYRSKSMLVIPMTNQEKEIIGVIQLLNATNPETKEVVPFTELHHDIIPSLASQAAIALTNDSLIKNLEQKIEEVEGHKAMEKELNEKLRHAFQETEKRREELQEALKKVKMVRKMGALFVLIILLAGGIYTWTSGIPLPREGSDESVSFREGEEITQSAQVMRSPISSSISMTGTLEPLEVVNVIAPVTGNIKEIHFYYGGLVEKGEVIMVLDSSEMEVKYRDAQSAFIKAQENFDNMEKWKEGAEVTNARRSITKAKYALETAKKNLEDTERLFKKDIVPETEYQSAKQQYESQEMDYQSATEELKAVLSKGDKKNMTIARYDLENARTRLKEAEAQLQRAKVLAPLSGIVLEPISASPGAESKKLERGSPTKEGELLISIGDLAGFSVNTRVDEVDINKIEVGQPVRVTGDAFPDIVLDGKLHTISSQASKGQGGFGGGAASFDVTVRADKLTPEQKKKVYIGMSANLEIMVYEKPDALVLPVQAVQMMGGMAFVTVKKPSAEGQTQTERIEVKTGYTTVDSVEILSGLKEGDEVAY